MGWRVNVASELLALGGYTKPLYVESGSILYDDLEIEERGIFFIESGVLKIERHSDNTLSRNSLGFSKHGTQRNVDTLGSRRARTEMGITDRDSHMMNAGNLASGSGTRFRLARGMFRQSGCFLEVLLTILTGFISSF